MVAALTRCGVLDLNPRLKHLHLDSLVRLTRLLTGLLVNLQDENSALCDLLRCNFADFASCPVVSSESF